MHLTPAALLLASAASLAAASPAALNADAPSPALARRAASLGASATPTPTITPAQLRRLKQLKKQYASLQTKQTKVGSRLIAARSSSEAVRSSLSSVSSVGASLEAIASHYPAPGATATPVLPPPSGCAEEGQVAAPGPNGGQDPVCVDYCFPRDASSISQTFSRAYEVAPGDNAACRALCQAKAKEDSDIAYYGVYDAFLYSAGTFGSVVLDGVECACISVAELREKVAAGLAGKGRGCSNELGGTGAESGDDASVAVFAINPAIV